MPFRLPTGAEDKPATIAFRFSVDSHTYTFGLTLPAWVYIWIALTVANSIGLTEPIKAIAHSAFKMLGVY